MKRKIKGFENYYIYDDGRVYSTFTQKFLVQTVNKGGYLYVNLYDKDGKHSKKIHRLVAMNFIPNPDNLPQVNHIDGNKLNNHVENLEWCDSSYNIRHAYAHSLINVMTEAHSKAARENGIKHRSRKIKCENIKTGEKFEFNSTREASEKLNLKYPSITSALLRGNVLFETYKFEYV